MRPLPVVIVLAVLFSGYQWLSDRPIVWGPGEMAADDPLQQPVQDEEPRSSTRVNAEEYELVPRASFEAQVRVLARERYYLGRFSDVAPLDLAVGWGPMSDSAVLDELDISQSGRFYFWQSKTNELPLERSEISGHSANWHLVPVNDQVWSQLKSVRVGDLVELSGELIDIEGNDGWQAMTSQTRTDTGAGACEIILVERVRIGPGVAGT